MAMILTIRSISNVWDPGIWTSTLSYPVYSKSYLTEWSSKDLDTWESI